MSYVDRARQGHEQLNEQRMGSAELRAWSEDFSWKLFNGHSFSNSRPNELMELYRIVTILTNTVADQQDEIERLQSKTALTLPMM